MLAQGMPFFQLGQDFLRSKPRTPKEGEPLNEVTRVDHNSYNSPDSTNSVKWYEKLENLEVFRYYKALIRLRRSNKLFRLRTKEDVGSCLCFLDTYDDNFIVMKLEDERDCLICMFNPYPEQRHFQLPEGNYYLRLDNRGRVNRTPVSGGQTVPPISAMIFKRFRRQVFEE